MVRLICREVILQLIKTLAEIRASHSLPNHCCLIFKNLGCGCLALEELAELRADVLRARLALHDECRVEGANASACPVELAEEIYLGLPVLDARQHFPIFELRGAREQVHFRAVGEDGLGSCGLVMDKNLIFSLK